MANDIGIEENYISPDNLKTQTNMNEIAKWTASNRLKLNEEKRKYMIFTRSLTEIATRLEVNPKVIDKIEETKLLGIWLTTYLDWSKNTKEICRKSYARWSLLTKLKHVGVS